MKFKHDCPGYCSHNDYDATDGPCAHYKPDGHCSFFNDNIVCDDVEDSELTTGN